jgi:putative nucleotidyltransferase with HDIG domain
MGPLVSVSVPDVSARAPAVATRTTVHRPNRLADLAYLTISLILHAFAFVIWQRLTREAFQAGGTGEAFALAMFPTALLPMYTRLAVGKGPMVVQVLALALILESIAFHRFASVQALAAGWVGGLRVSPPSGRGSVIRAGAWAGLASAVALAITSITMVEPEVIAAGMAGALLGELVSASLLLALSPFAERIFGHVTALTLIESLSYDHPLLRRLLTEAPGTFLHSTNVAVLADVGARAVGADALAARVGGLYHDVGKTRAPELFAENQSGDAPPAELTPSEGARVLLGHVKEGVTLVLSHGLGERVADFVREHHGTSEMRSMIDRLEDTSTGPGAAFTYPGPRPRSRETAVVMLADRSEAMARARRPSSRDDCLGLAREVVDRTHAEGQLATSGLSDVELEQIERAFADVLFAIHHKRDGYRDPEATPSRPRPALRP